VNGNGWLVGLGGWAGPVCGGMGKGEGEGMGFLKIRKGLGANGFQTRAQIGPQVSVGRVF